MTDQPRNQKVLAEAVELCSELLRNIELRELALGDCALKAARVARLLNDEDQQRIFQYEAGGYPSAPDGVPTDVFGLAIRAGREIKKKDNKTEEIKTYVYTEPISALEAQVKIVEVSLAAAKDPDVSVSSANPHQAVWNPTGNILERNSIRENYMRAVRQLSERSAYLYRYASETFYRLRLSGIADDVFVRNRNRADVLIGALAPESVQKFVAVHDNLASDNPEDWANAVHSCRRILQDIADIVFPATEPEERGGKTIKLGPNNYINRIVCFVEDNKDSDTFSSVVGSHLKFIGDRLDAVFNAAQKGSHSTVSREEAERYVIYTYLLAGDILTLRSEEE